MSRGRFAQRCLVWVFLACFLVSGCLSTGPRSIWTGRGNYNIAIAQTNNQQLLLNLVRLRYRDAPVFLAISSISTSFTFEVDVGAGDFGGLGVAGVSGGLAYAEKPTVTYAPLQGEQFVNQLMAPMSLRVILLLYHSGWRIDRVSRVCLQSLGRLPNAPGTASPTPILVPEYEEFAKVITHLRTLQTKGLTDLLQLGDDEHAVVLQIRPDAVDLPEVREIVEVLGLPEGSTRWTLTRAGGGGEPGSLHVVTRSLVGSMFFLSLGVEPPTRDEEAGRVTVTRERRLPDRLERGDGRPPPDTLERRRAQECLHGHRLPR